MVGRSGADPESLGSNPSGSMLSILTGRARGFEPRRSGFDPQGSHVRRVLGTGEIPILALLGSIPRRRAFGSQVLSATRQPSKLKSGVRFPGLLLIVSVAQSAERHLAKVEAAGS